MSANGVQRSPSGTMNSRHQDVDPVLTPLLNPKDSHRPVLIR
ncbi:hypothetical protein [Leptolyngbya sp. CCY15150]|nr:hypothetical protein [Leptolyngbya sp. CCY15150]